MSRKIIQDIFSRETPANRSKDVNKEGSLGHHNSPKRRTWTTIFFILAGSGLALGVFLILSSSFSRVLVKVATTRKDINLSEVAFLNKDGSGGGIKYQVMLLKTTESAKVHITGVKVISKSATGIATIYNSYSSAPQNLVSGTRLETKDGKIYKIEKPVIVPGTTVVGGKVIPGSINISVRASSSGANYNIPPSDFTIPGFAGNPKYLKIYAKSKEDITGGFSGEIKTVTQSDLQEARSKLKNAIGQKLTKDAFTQVPKGFLLYEDATVINFADNSIDNSSLVGDEEGGMNLKVTGTLSAIIISSDDLKKFIVDKKLGDLKGDTKVIISNLDKITLTILNKDKINLNSNINILVKFSGNLPIIWDFDEKIFKSRLLGIKKSKYQDVLRDFNMIEKAEATLSPSWALYFPSSLKRIEIDKGF